tara:strand:- start:473 stop:895 length:423 start_codon:yes stop_codon:yes gene_type:complete
MKTTIYNQGDIDREITAATKAAELRASIEKHAEDLRRQQLSDLGKSYGVTQLANEAIRDDISVERFRNDAVIRTLEQERDALQNSIDNGTRAPARNAMLGGIPGKEDRLLDRLSEAQQRNDPQAKYEAIQALRKNREENK